MVDSYNHEPDAPLERMARVYRRRNGKWTIGWAPGDPPDVPFPRASGGMISTAGDYFRFLQMYLDGGVEPVRRLVLEQLSERIDQAAERPGDKDYKTRLQEVAAHDGFTPPVYALTESGPDHHKRFHATVAVGGERLGAGTGTSKKEAEQKAARAAYERRSAQDGVCDDV